MITKPNLVETHIENIELNLDKVKLGDPNLNLITTLMYAIPTEPLTSNINNIAAQLGSRKLTCREFDHQLPAAVFQLLDDKTVKLWGDIHLLLTLDSKDQYVLTVGYVKPLKKAFDNQVKDGLIDLITRYVNIYHELSKPFMVE